jgi:hypothetical protein
LALWGYWLSAALGWRGISSELIFIGSRESMPTNEGTAKLLYFLFNAAKLNAISCTFNGGN